MKKQKNIFKVQTIISLISVFIFFTAESCVQSNGGTKKEENKSSKKEITSFKFTNALNPSLTGDIDGTITGNEIRITVPKNISTSNLKPSIIVSEKATVNPASGTARDFSESVTYTVTAEDKTAAIYTVIVSKEMQTNDNINVTFKVNGNFGYLKAQCGAVSGKTASAAAISVPKNSTVIFTAESMDGFEVKKWSIENASFSTGGNPKNNEAQAGAGQNFTVSVEFTAKEKPQEPVHPVTLQTLSIGKKTDFETDDYDNNIKPIIEKIKSGDTTQILETKQPALDISFFTEEEMTEVILDGTSLSPDLGEPCFFKGAFTLPEAGGIKTITAVIKAKENKQSTLSFKVKRLSGKVAMPEDNFKLFIDNEEVSSYTYRHLSDTDNTSLPVIKTKTEQVEVSVRTKNTELAGKVIFAGNDYLFSGEENMNADFSVAEISETEKIVSFNIEAKNAQSYEQLTWRFKIKKVKTLKPVTALLYVDNEIAPFEITQYLTEGTPGTLEVSGNTSLISVRTYEAQAIQNVVIDGNVAQFVKKTSGAKYRYESTVNNITSTAREIVIVITPKDSQYDETTWRFNIKTKEAEVPQDMFLYVDGVSVPENVSNNLTSTIPGEMSVTNNSATITVKKINSDIIESVIIDGQPAVKTAETGSLSGSEIYVFSREVQNLTPEFKLIEIVITPKDTSKYKPVIWRLKLKNGT